jgi:hypothetical protein
MSNKAKTLANSVIAFIVIIITLKTFLSINAVSGKTAIDWYALIFVLISEAALFGGIIITTTGRITVNSMLLKVGVITTLAIYWIASIVISTFTRGVFMDNIGGFVTTHMILCAIVAIIIIIFWMFASSISAKDEKSANSRLLMQNCEELAFSLKSNKAYSDYHDLLNKLYEEIKYSDKTASIDKESMIYNQITELSNTLNSNNNSTATVQDVFQAVDAIILNIKERNMGIRNLKQGGF